MALSPQIRMLPDGRRLHLQHGPMDLIVGASGRVSDCRDAYSAASRRFVTILDELCGELPVLRSPVEAGGTRPDGVVARRMYDAVQPFATRGRSGEPGFVTPMAAVAGAVADEVLGALVAAAPLARAYVNNGGDIALHLAPGTSFRIGLVDRPDHPGLFGATTIEAGHGVRGVATSGWRGRSFSLGIADAVTVLARNAAAADAAATMVANAVDLPRHRAVLRVPARDVQPDSDLGARLVTRGVGPLGPHEIAAALDAGAAEAESLRASGLIAAAALHLQEETRIVGTLGSSAGSRFRGERDRARVVPYSGRALPSPHPSPAREREPRGADRVHVAGEALR